MQGCERWGWSKFVRSFGMASMVAMVMVLAVSSASAAPIVGLYQSDDMDGGVFLTGRWTEGFVGGNPDGVGNGAHAGSWDGASLFTQWELAGPTLTSTALLYDGVSGGNGTRVYQRNFDATGATAVLQPAAWWTAPGDSAYTADLDFYQQTLTILFWNNTPVFASSVESFHGTFDGFPAYTITGQANGAYVGQGLSLPAGYPSWIPGSAVGGAWGDTGLVRIEITPEPATLGLLGMGVATMLLRRKRR